MFHLNRNKISWPRTPTCRIKEDVYLTPCITITFLIGLILGSLIGTLTVVPLELFIPFESKDVTAADFTFFTSLWRSIQFSILSAFLATSILGAVLIPVLSACRAYIFACSAAIILRKTATYSFVYALISMGIPAIINFPAFFIASSDAFAISRYLLKRDEKYRICDLPLLQHLMIVCLLCIVETIYLTYIVPLLMPHLAVASR